MNHKDPQTLRRLLSRWTTGVAVITTVGRDGLPLGKAVNSFHSVSLDPPLVGWCVDVRSTRYDEWVEAPGYVVHVVSEGQADLVKRFARSGGDKFDGLDWEPGPFGMPLISEASVRLECQMWKQVEAGDHTYLIAEVIEVEDGPVSALLFHAGQPRTLAELAELHSTAQAVTTLPRPSAAPPTPLLKAL
ncbi:flavin reductase [Terrabacter tumescens]|uniref:Flavin reductase n=1 Tax=Terrabacter tumescens TaxID=60443 RepID=A0ABQ2I244_9MICO|nr:flavin reductase family protein [Terrabacter tumescens]GGM98286.1 flavin reductase [Terrabacter tumescens]